MITEYDLQEAIAECEGQRNPNANTCLKLAAFYTIRDKLYPAKKEEADIMPVYSTSSEPIKSETEFMQAVQSIDRESLLSIIDELMTTLQVILPRLYDGVMRKIKQN